MICLVAERMLDYLKEHEAAARKIALTSEAHLKSEFPAEHYVANLYMSCHAALVHFLAEDKEREWQ